MEASLDPKMLISDLVRLQAAAADDNLDPHLHLRVLQLHLLQGQDPLVEGGGRDVCPERFYLPAISWYLLQNPDLDKLV